MASLGKAKYFSKMNANSGFWQIKLEESSRELTTFITLFGRYCFNRMPSSIKKAKTSNSPIRVRLNITDSDKTRNKTMNSLVRIFRTIANDAVSTGSPDKLTTPNTETISALLKKKEEKLKKLRDFTRRMEEKIESECMEAIRRFLEHEKPIESLLLTRI